MTVTPIIHVREIETALAFYCDVLGFDCVLTIPAERAGKLMHAQIERDGATLMIGLLPDDGGRDDRLGDGVELYFRISEDIDSYCERLRLAGARIIEEPGNRFWGDRTFSIGDPNGYWLTFARVNLPRTKDELLERIADAWDTLGQTLRGLSAEQLTGLRDEGGWSVKDHVIHLAAWERSIIYLLQGRPRHEGLGVDELLYLSEDEDAINAAIWERYRDRPLHDVFDEFRATHQTLLETLERLSYDDLLKTYSHYLPEEPGEESGEPIIGRVVGNTEHHYMLHRLWIQRLAG